MTRGGGPGLVERLRERVPLLDRRPDDAAEVDEVAAVVERLAVLLTAGVPAAAAWRHLAEVGGAPVLVAAASAAERGESVALAVDEATRPARQAAAAGGLLPERAGGWAVLAAAWAVASESGAPLTASLRELGSALRDEAQLRREVRTSLAGPTASARMVLALPLVALAFGALLGFDTAAVLLGNPIGMVCLVLGIGFLFIARRWSRSLAARASAFDDGAGLELELLAIAMAGGASVERARRCVADALAAHRVRSLGGAAIVETVALAERAGAPLVDLLRAEARRHRRMARTEAATRGAALGVRLMLPLGVCVLPAFVLLGVAPLLISVVTGTLGGAA
ncbi:type II secretion system F family protein [Agromyces salentinus]|uniref:Type II secretion system protein GspF domain-containing protein n=1 Tax=Agromyces salentinus TaxID=269421 RepID=A0ABN2MYJ1_9MICO|nr:type II secretion system F family protein [Agromyces salentinus]